MSTAADTLNAKAQVSDDEWATRVDLAAAYRLIALHGWDDLIFTHISAAVPGEPGHFLINPYGMLFEEITASSLVKINLAGDKVMESPYPINPAGFTIHSAIHEVRHDVKCVMHTHTRAGIAVSAQKQGLLPLSQQSLFLVGVTGYHDYEGVALNEEEKPRLVADLGQRPALILRNHGLLTAADSIAGAFLVMYTLESACQIQIAAQSGGGELTHIPAPILAGAAQQQAGVTLGMGAGLIWPGLLRKLDRRDTSYRD
ncbi:MAG: class II aldolase/adducin family protein [Pseudomonadota bacterium]